MRKISKTTNNHSMKKILLMLMACINAVTMLAQKPGVYKKASNKAADKTEAPCKNEYMIVGINGNTMLFEPYVQRNSDNRKERVRFRMGPGCHQSGGSNNDSTYKVAPNPPEVEDFVSLLSGDFTTPTNNILGVWYHEASGIKCYKIFSPTRSLLIFIYESPEGSMETANAILEAVNYGKDQVVAEDGTRYSVRWEGADTMVVTYTMEGKRHREQWTRSQLPTYLSGLFMSLGTN